MAMVLGAELGRQVRDAIDAGLQPAPDIVTYVPTHWLRRMQRGIDHGACLAEAVGRELRVDVWPLLETRLFARQTGSGREARTGRGGRFTCRTRAPCLTRVWRSATRAAGWDLTLGGATVLLVDDVRTTGGTCSEAASALRRAGASRVVVACCAAVDPPNRSGARFGVAEARSR
jgi:predicted amidophosphoribosyltransferase